MMRSIFLKWGLIAILPLFMACTSESEAELDTLGEVKFTVDFADFNAEQVITNSRSASKTDEIKEQVVDLGNNVLALVSLQRDTMRTTNLAATRVLRDDTYTMLAYDHETHAFKGETVGQILDYEFIVTGKRLRLGAGKYDFVLFNSKVKREGNKLIVSRENATSAFIGRTTEELDARPNHKYVSLNLKRVGAMVRLDFETYTQFENIEGELMSVDAVSVPENCEYDAPTGALQTGSYGAFEAPVKFDEGKEEYNGAVVCKGAPGVSFVNGTDVTKLKLVFTKGKMFGKDISGVEYLFKPSKALKLEANGYYVLKVKMFYNFFYLMADGGIGRVAETVQFGGERTPIALVLSRSKRVAIALHYAEPNNYMWCDYKYTWKEGGNYTSTHVIDEEHGDKIEDAIWGRLATKGIDETWNASYSTDKVKGNKVKAENPDFYAIYTAAHYDPKVEYTGTKPLKWYLPSASDALYLFNLGKGDKKSEKKYGRKQNDLVYKWDGWLVSAGFVQVGGDRILRMTNMWTSTQWDPLIDIVYNNCKYAAATVNLDPDAIEWRYSCYQFSEIVRPFINY